MALVKINEPHLSKQCINQCLIQYKDITPLDPTLTIEATCVVETVDVLLIGYLLLLDRQAYNDDIKNLKINIHLPFNVKPYTRPKSGDYHGQAELEKLKVEYEKETGVNFSDEIGRTIRQYMAYAFLQSKRPFTVTYGYALESNKDDDITIFSKEKTSWFVISEKFIPILFINPTSYNYYFVNSPQVSDAEQSVSYSPINHELYQSFSDTLKTGIYNPNSKDEGFQTLSRLAFFKALSNARILNFYIKPDAVESRQAGDLKGQNAANYFSAVRPIFDELERKPPIFHFIFSTLMASALLPTKLNGDTKEGFETTIGSLWNFVKELVYGIQELAKNIVEHSTSKQGIITARTYDAAVFARLNPELDQLFTEDEKRVNRQNQSYFEVNVVDSGLEGVLETLLKQSKAIYRENPSTETKVDIEQIVSGKISFGDLLNPNQPLRLFQQAKRATAHLGLLTLAKLIDNNSGMLRASTWTAGRETEDRLSETIYRSLSRQVTQTVNFGTNYHFVLPIHFENSYGPQFIHEEGTKPEVSPEYARGIEQLSEFEVLGYEDFDSGKLKDFQIYQVKLDKAQLGDVSVEYWDIFPLRNIVRSSIKKKVAFCLQLDDNELDFGRLFRLLGNWELVFTGIPLIIIGVSTETFQRLVNANKLYAASQKMPFWNEKSLVIFYSFVEHAPSGQRFYYTDAIWGAHENDFLALNKMISKSTFNSMFAVKPTEHQQKENKEKERLSLNIHQIAHLDKFGLFHHPESLLPLDLLISARAPFSIFEENALSLLQNRIEPIKEQHWQNENPLLRYFLSMPGYKIADSHFRIGSKLHVDNFYYAKRFFQNSFFAFPLAYLLTQEILRILKASGISWSKVETNGLTLFGYGQYSALLMSLVEQFLIKKLQLATGKNYTADTLKINYEIISDAEEGSFLKNDIIHQYGVLITPIASTFSTSIKMEAEIRGSYPEIILLKPHLNVIYIFNSGDENIGKDDIEYRFGIRSQDFARRTVSVDAFSNDTKNVQQRFWLPLQTNWEPVENCRFCVPTTPGNIERPLFYTDKTMVTPALIFDKPVSKQLSGINNNPFILTRDSLKYGHYTDQNTHYMFYVEVVKFFEDNFTAIREWLEKLKKEATLAKYINEGEHVILIAPSHYANAGFLNLVNEVLFSNIATIIQYDAQSDHIQNFQLFYEHEIKGKGNTVIFIDDVIMSGNTFLRTNYFLKLNREKFKGFDACITLLDRSDLHVHENLKRKLYGEAKVVYAFASLHLPALSAQRADCPVCQEQTRYKAIASNSFLDKVKYHFLEQAEKISPLSIDLARKRLLANKNITVNPADYKKINFDFYYHQDSGKYIRRVDAIHRIYEWFNIAGNAQKFEGTLTFSDWVLDVLSSTQSPILSSDLVSQPAAISLERYHSGKATDVLLKILTQSPFTQYKPVKEKIFSWIIGFLKQERVAYTPVGEEASPVAPFDREVFRKIKFLLRRATLINQNYLISKEVFLLMKVILGEAFVPRLIQEEKKALEEITLIIESKAHLQQLSLSVEDDQLRYQEHLRSYRNLVTFIWFFSGQVKELIHLNEARSIKLEKTLMELEQDTDNPPLFKQLLRIIREENGVIFRRFSEFFEPKPEETFDNTGQIYLALAREQITEHYRFQTLGNFLKNAHAPAPAQNDPLLNYLVLLNYLLKERSSHAGSLVENTRTIMTTLQRILFESSECCGSFLIVKYRKGKEDKYFVAHNDGDKGRMKEDLWNKEDSNYIQKFLNGGIEHNGAGMITITNLERQGENWVDTFKITNTGSAERLSKHVLPEQYNRLLMIRINNLDIQSMEKGGRFFSPIDKPLGVMGFYSGSVNTQSENYNQRYLLLLREALATFIKEHHENSEFRDWIEADDFRRVALLTGHGRDMLMRLATTVFPVREGDLPYKQIVSTIHLIQHFMMDIKRDESMGSIYMLLFKKYFSPQLVDTKFFKEIRNLVEHIFKIDEIENKVPLDFSFFDVDENGNEILVDEPSDPCIEFSWAILQMIFFELTVNAKKNRWLLYPEGVKNRVQINVFKREKDVVVTFRNTGPAVPSIEYNALNSDGNSKRENEASGIYLIKRMLETFRLGSIGFYGQPFNGSQQWFNVKLTITPWNDEKNSIN